MGMMSLYEFDERVDRLFCVGDLVDRGPSSFETVQLLRNDWFYAVRGNHDWFWIDALTSDSDAAARDAERSIAENAGGLTLADMLEGRSEEEIKEVATLLRAMPDAIEVTVKAGAEQLRYGVVHAEPPETWEQVKTLDEMSFRRLSWERARFRPRYARRRPITSAVPDIDIVVTGHNALEDEAAVANVICIDTAAFITNDVRLYTPLQIKSIVEHG